MMKKTFTILIGILFCTLTATAQEPEGALSATTQDREVAPSTVTGEPEEVALAATTDSLRQQIDALNAQLAEKQNDERNDRVWKDRAKYANIGYVSQKLIFKDFDAPDLKNDFGVSLSWGKTYYLHKKPLFGMLKFGLDWSWIDVNYAKYTITDTDAEVDPTDKDFLEIGNHQLEYGMQFGPSVTINPVQDLKISLYFRVTPSFSMMYMDDNFNYSYATFLNFGGAVAWKVISLGVEGRWGSAKYDGFAFDQIDIDSDNPSFEDASIKTKIKTSSIRFYIGFRF